MSASTSSSRPAGIDLNTQLFTTSENEYRADDAERAVSASKGNYERLRGSKLSLRSERPPRIVHQNLKAMI
jgi:hypothetical protein